MVDGVPTRDHTEIMLAAMGADIAREGNTRPRVAAACRWKAST